MMWLCIIVTFYVLFVSTNAERGCVRNETICSKCQCSEDRTRIKCSKNTSLTDLESFPQNLIYLKVQHSGLKSIESDAFRSCFKLETLILTNNHDLIYIYPGAFQDTPLKTLHLQSNSLDLTTSTNVFSPLTTSLKELSIFQNKKIPDEVFKPLSSLENLVISGNANGTFGVDFEGLLSLKTLRIKAPIDGVNMSISNNTFENFSVCGKLSNLNLRNANLISIATNPFTHLEYLKHLDLGYNSALKLDDLNGFLEFPPPVIEVLELSYLVGNFNPTLTLTEDFFGKLRNQSNLKILDLGKNDIVHIEAGFSTSLKHLEKLVISYNRLTDVLNLVAGMFIMVNLSYIDASYQAKRYPGLPENKQLSSIKDLPIENFAASKTIDKGNRCKAGAIEHINCTFPKNTYFGDMSFMSWCLPCPRNLKTVKLDSFINADIKNLPPMLFLGYCSLVNISLRHNGFENITGPIMIDRPSKSGEPMQVDLSFNGITCLAWNVFKLSMERGLIIGKLLLEGNELSDQLSNDEGGHTFSLYSNLTELNLASNRIKKLFKNSFQGLRSLEILNLSRNSLQVIPFDVLDLTKLRYLDISENLIVFIDDAQLNDFALKSATAGYVNFIIAILDNPLQCSCSTLDFLSWIISNSTKISNYNKLECLYSDGMQKHLTEIGSIHRELRFFCYAALPLEITGGLLGLAMICCLVGTLAYRYRWDIRYYMLQRAQNKRRQRLSMYKCNYKYDAFVCYEMSDRDWVVKELLLNLETLSSARNRIAELSNDCNITSDSVAFSTDDDEKSIIDDDKEKLIRQRSVRRSTCSTSEEEFITDDRLRLCIHERDFMPGCQVESNIQSALESSRKVILVVSKNFLKSQWCSLELEMAKVESLLRGVNLVVTVFLEPVEEKFVSLEWLTKYYTYLEWYKFNEYRRHEFWRRLRIALGTTKSGIATQGSPDESQ